ncbi:MAG: Fic family protein [Bacilli bacterium]|nr:Fic family protein [Bacilli bacterium]
MNEIQDQINWDSYLIPGSNVLKNKLNITNYNELKEQEKSLVRKKLAYLYLKPINGNFNIEHLLNIHKFIFDEIYPFAGEFRTCSMQKNTKFCNPQEIEHHLKEVLTQMNDVFSQDISSIQEFAFKLGSYYYDLIYTHPFREGNGRSIRVFIRDFVLEKSKNMSCGPLDLDYTKIDSKNLLMGTVNRYICPSMIEVEFMKGLVELEKNKIK